MQLQTSIILDLPPGEFDAYIFDCDGTLADTMPTHYKAWQAALGDRGRDFPEAMFYELGGVPTARIVEILNERHGHHLPVNETVAHKEALFEELGYRDAGDFGALVLEVDRPPPPVIVDKLLRDCGLEPAGLGLVMTPTASLAGTTQVVARVLEVALHRAHELGFALGDIVEGDACAPLPSPGADGLEAMARTNDAILYGGQVHLSVRGDDAAALALARHLPSTNSRDHGRSFADIFKEAGYDFYKIDAGLFAPAEVWVSNLDSGHTWHGGALNMALLRQLWLQEA